MLYKYLGKKQHEEMQKCKNSNSDIESKKIVNEHDEKKNLSEKEIVNDFKLIKCPSCGKEISNMAEICVGCGFPIQKYLKEQLGEEKEFTGVYRYSNRNGKQEVHCPRCGSENCSHYQEQKIIPAKTKTKYTANLNPFKPFTLVNKKEKVVKKEKVKTESKFICNACGNIFY